VDKDSNQRGNMGEYKRFVANPYLNTYYSEDINGDVVTVYADLREYLDAITAYLFAQLVAVPDLDGSPTIPDAFRDAFTDTNGATNAGTD
jgi:hypothetical protein